MPKTKVTAKEMSQALLYALTKFSNHFYNDFGAYVQAKYDFKLDATQLVTFKRQIYMINMWIISKALSSDKKVLDELHKMYLLPHVNQDQIDQWLDVGETENLKNVLRQDESELRERYIRYYSEWDDSGSKSEILSLTMLEHMFNKGQPDNRLINADLFFRVNTHVLGMMKSIHNFRDNYELIIK